MYCTLTFFRLLPEHHQLFADVIHSRVSHKQVSTTVTDYHKSPYHKGDCNADMCNSVSVSVLGGGNSALEYAHYNSDQQQRCHIDDIALIDTAKAVALPADDERHYEAYKKGDVPEPLCGGVCEASSSALYSGRYQ